MYVSHLSLTVGRRVSQAISWRLPFENMDKSSEESCKQFDAVRTCGRGNKCMVASSLF